jgi:hypothetical protein
MELAAIVHPVDPDKVCTIFVLQCINNLWPDRSVRLSKHVTSTARINKLPASQPSPKRLRVE